jgi:hypothetical protein
MNFSTEETLSYSYSEESDSFQSTESAECPPAPIKNPYMFTEHRPSPALVKALNNKFMSDMQNEVLGNIANTSDTSFINDLPRLANVEVCKKTLIMGNRQGEKCGKAVYKCELCSYHWGLWKREHPFLKSRNY